MGLYYFHVSDRSGRLIDPDGVQCVDDAAARTTALAGARDLICAGVAEGYLDLTGVIEAWNDAGNLVHRIRFDEAVVRVA